MDNQSIIENGSIIFRQSMRRLVTGVTIVTVPVGDGMTGFTASSFTSVSLDPPLVLVCVSNNSRSLQHIKNSQKIAIHILGNEQSVVAKNFARSDVDKSKICEWALSAMGNPILESYLTVFECLIHDIYQVGDNSIVIGRVINIKSMEHDIDPLVYYQGKMFSIPNLSNLCGDVKL